MFFLGCVCCSVCGFLHARPLAAGEAVALADGVVGYARVRGLCRRVVRVCGASGGQLCGWCGGATYKSSGIFR